MNLDDLKEKAEQLENEPVESMPDTTEPTEESEPKPDSEQPTDAPDQAASEEDVSAEPEQQPEFDFSYTVLDEKKELPEQVRAIIKSKEDEAYWKEVFSKADGIDHLKKRHEYTKGERDEFRTKYTDLNTKVEKFQHFAKTNLGEFFKAAGVTKDQVFDYVQHQLKLQDMTPEDRAQYERSEQATVQNWELQQQLKQQEEFSRQLAMQQHNFQLTQALSKPDVSTFISEFDSRMGSGAFRQQVEEYGNTLWAMKQEYASPEEAVTAVYNKYKPLFASAPVQPQVVTNQQVAATSTPKPASIPNVGKGRNVSHTASSVRNLDDIRALAKKYESAEAY